jgi:hypothetical protein
MLGRVTQLCTTRTHNASFRYPPGNFNQGHGFVPSHTECFVFPLLRPSPFYRDPGTFSVGIRNWNVGDESERTRLMATCYEGSDMLRVMPGYLFRVPQPDGAFSSGCQNAGCGPTAQTMRWAECPPGRWIAGLVNSL